MQVDENYFKYTLSDHYYPNQVGPHYINFNTKVHGGVELKNGMFECSKKGFYRFGFYAYVKFLQNEQVYFYFHKNQTLSQDNKHQ